LWKNVVKIVERGTAGLAALSELIRVWGMRKKWILGKGIFTRVKRWERSCTERLMGI
jgi:hypothetical protein